MIIGVDAGALSIQDERLKVGVYRVNVELLKYLAKIDTKNFYRLYSFLPIQPSLMREFGEKMKNIVLSPAAGYMSVRIPLELLLHPVDFFLGLSQALPPFPHIPSIGCMYDLGFLHAPEAYGSHTSSLMKQTRNLCQKADHIIAISETTKDDIHQTYAYPKNRISVSYPGVGAQFSPHGLRYTNKNPYVLFVGSLKKGKNIPILISAFARFLRKENTAYELFLIGGDYWPDPEIEQTIKQEQVQDSVLMPGYVPEKDLPSYYRGAFAFASPSLWEGFCLTAIEAMACGTPVICSNTGSFPEIVGDNGILVDPQDISALASSLSLIANPSKRHTLCLRGIKRVKKFRWEGFARTIHDQIAKAIYV